MNYFIFETDRKNELNDVCLVSRPLDSIFGNSPGEPDEPKSFTRPKFFTAKCVYKSIYSWAIDNGCSNNVAVQAWMDEDDD